MVATLKTETENANQEATAASAPPIASYAALTLTPKVHPVIKDFLADQAKLQELVKALGSPLNVMFPELVHENVEAFNGLFKKHGLRGKVFFAHKTNSSDSLVRQLAHENACLDVSSLNELRHGLSSGFTGDRIEATGPKNREFLALALQQGITISIDSIWELNQVLELRQFLKLQKPTKVLIRLSGFHADHSRFLNKGSRFGITINELEEAFDILEENEDALDFMGFSFHLDTVSITERAVAIENCIELYEDALGRGFEPRVLCIGGGFKVNYLESEQEWNEYTSALKEAVLGTGPSMTWQGNAFGMYAEKGKLRGNFNSYNYYDDKSGPDFLDEILSHQFPNLSDKTAGALLRDNMIELWIEPGRSLVTQTGITVASVNNLRPSSTGDQLVNLNMKRQDVTFLDQEIFVDPIVLNQTTCEKPGKYGVFFAGNLCLESDLVYRHKTFLSQLPEPGDLVVFPNTSGYFMDFSATNSMMEPIARKVAVRQRNGKFEWMLDEQYSII
jgi:diaminopimelate decarboxylase